MGYAAAGLARGIAGGMGMVSNALMGIQQRKADEEERQMRLDAQRAEAEERQLDRARYNSENGITEGFTNTSVRMDPLDVPTDVFAGQRAKPTPSPLSMAPERTGGVMQGQGIGMQPTGKLQGPSFAGRGVIEAPQVAPAPDVAFRTPFVEQDVTQGTRYQNDQRLRGLARMQADAAENARKAELLQSVPPELRDRVAGLSADGIERVLGTLATREPPKPEERRTGFRPNDGALVYLDTGEVITPGATKPADVPNPNQPVELNDAQGKSVAFYQRGVPALKQLEDLADAMGGAAGDNVAAGPNPWRRNLGRLWVVGNAMKGDQLQQYDRAALDLALVLLRKDSGASLTKQEQAFANDTWIPQPNDSPGNAARKLEAARQALESMRYTAGPGTTLMGEPTAQRFNANALPDDIEAAAAEARRRMGR